MRCAVLLALGLIGSALAVPSQPLRRALEGEVAEAEEDAAEAAEREANVALEQAAADKGTARGEAAAEAHTAIAAEKEESPDETIARWKEALEEKQGVMKDFILANGVDNRTYILDIQAEIQAEMKVLKKIVDDNAPPPPPPAYADGLGECVDGDCEEGKGVYEWADGGRFEGHFKNSSKNGHGTYFNEESGNYTGEWANGRPDGVGTFIAKDNQWNYTGGYAEGMMNGEGIYIFERCRWSMVEHHREHYCANKNRIVLYRGTSSYKGSLSECAALVQKNPGCGTELYYAGSSTAPTSDCVCIAPVRLDNPSSCLLKCIAGCPH